MSSELKVYLPGAAASGDARRALKVMTGILDVLDQLDAPERPEQAGKIQWKFTELGVSSVKACTAVERPRRNQTIEEADSLLPRFVEGMRSAEEHAAVPPGWDFEVARKARSMLKSLGDLRIEVQVIGDLATEPYVITKQAWKNLDEALQTKQETIGSLTGRIEAVNFHEGKNEAKLWLEAPRRSVSVSFDEEQAEKVTAALRKRVQVSGLIQRDRTRQAQSIKLRSLRVLTAVSASELIELAGAFPDFTGNMTVDEYLEELRGAS